MVWLVLWWYSSYFLTTFPHNIYWIFFPFPPDQKHLVSNWKKYVVQNPGFLILPNSGMLLSQMSQLLETFLLRFYHLHFPTLHWVHGLMAAAAAAAKSLQPCLTLSDLMDGSPPGSPVHGILQARTLGWVTISFSNAWKWKVKVKSLSRVQPSATPRTTAYQAPPSMGFSR